MTKTLSLTIAQKDIDENNTESNLLDYSLTVDYSRKETREVSIKLGSYWQIINFGNLNTAKFVKITSEQFLNIEINNSIVYENMKFILINFDVYSINVQNLSAYDSNVYVELYGE